MAIILGGMPSVPSNKALLKFLAKKGYWTFYPRYRGTWESGGQLFKKSPVKDVLDILDELPKGFKEPLSGKVYKIKPTSVVLFAGSFGGAVGLLAAKDKRVTKVVALSPVADWRAKSPLEPPSVFYLELRALFFMGYRFRDADFKKVVSGRLFNPIDEASSIRGEKVLILHTKNDRIVTLPAVRRFARLTGSSLKVFKTGGHFGGSTLLKPKVWKLVSKFLKA